MLKNLQVAAFNLKQLSDYQSCTNKSWQIYFNLDAQRSCRILQNYLKPLISFQQEIVGDLFIGAPCMLIGLCLEPLIDGTPFVVQQSYLTAKSAPGFSHTLTYCLLYLFLFAESQSNWFLCAFLILFLVFTDFSTSGQSWCPFS